MAASTGGEDIQEASSVENAPRPPITTQQNVGKVEDVSANGTVSCSSFVGVNKNSSVLRPSGFTSSNASNASGKSIPVFGTSVSSSHFGSVSLQTFGVSPQKNPFSLRRSVFGSNQDSDSGAKKPVVLKASQLEPQTGSAVSSTTHNANCSFVLSPAKLNNPFFKAVSESEETSSSTITSSTSVAGHSVNCHETLSEKGNSSNSLKSDVPKVSFVPLASSSGSSNQGNSQTPAPTTGTTTVPTFVFGQNLHERVEVSAEAVRSEVESSDVTTSDAVTHHEEASKTNGVTPEMLFSSVIQRELPDKQSEVGSDEKKQKSLSEAAREYEESRAVKRKYEEVTVKTGEEEEMNVLQINCKLFAFNKDKSTWVERGRGTLRLNDLSTDNRTQSRVVMRVSGSLRVVLNTKIWAEMVVDRPSDKSLRLTAMDGSGEIKVFLVMAGVKEIDQLFKALEWRVNNQKKLATACDKSSENNET